MWHDYRRAAGRLAGGLAVGLSVACGASPATDGVPAATPPGEGGAAPATRPIVQLQRGIDVSGHSGSVDWRAVAADGHGFAFVKATEGVDLEDPAFDDHWQAMLAAVILLGAYPSKPDPAREEFIFQVFPRLAERRKQDAGTMSGGEQQMLAVARALMSQPRVLMLDEPTTGLAPRLAREAYEALAHLRDAGLTLVVAEQQVPLALELASRGYVLENGRIELAGTSDELAGNPDVQRAYLGVA